MFSKMYLNNTIEIVFILLGKTVDLKGIGYNTNQSEIAIGSEDGSEGVLEETKGGGFVPEQHTDYILPPLVKNGAL
jgi:cell division protein FtsW (lipid II flippase)